MSCFSIQNTFVIMLFTLIHCVYVYKIMDGGCSTSAPFQQKLLGKHWIISWCIEILVCFYKNKFKRHRIDWFMWRLTTTIACHYLHTLEMKKKGFIKNKVVEAIVTWTMEKATLLPFTHVYQPTFESDGVWGV